MFNKTFVGLFLLYLSIIGCECNTFEENYKGFEKVHGSTGYHDPGQYIAGRNGITAHTGFGYWGNDASKHF